jgi:hypothetical protein
MDALAHLKDNGHIWIIVPCFAAGIGFLLYGIVVKQTEAQLTANVFLALMATATVAGSVIGAVVLALLKKEQCGELAEVRPALVLGLLGGAFISVIKLLSLLGIV